MLYAHKYPLSDESLAEIYTVESSSLIVASAKLSSPTNIPFACFDLIIDPSLVFNWTKLILNIEKST